MEQKLNLYSIHSLQFTEFGTAQPNLFIHYIILVKILGHTNRINLVCLFYIYLLKQFISNLRHKPIAVQLIGQLLQVDMTSPPSRQDTKSIFCRFNWLVYTLYSCLGQSVIICQEGTILFKME